MITALRAEFHLTKPLMGTGSGLPDRFGKKLRIHKMRTGTGNQKTAVFHKLHAPQVDFTIPLNRILNGISGLGKGRRIQDNHIKFFSLSLQPGKKLKDIGTLKMNPILQPVQPRIFLSLQNPRLGRIHPENTFRPCNSGI